MYEFGWPWALALLPLPLLVWWLIPPLRQRRTALAVPFFEQLVALTGEKPGPGAVVASRTIWQHGVRLLGWVLLVGALASPQFVGEPSLVVKSARNVMVAVDISPSMDTRDFRDPDGRPMSRYDAVNEVLDTFISRREGDRMGLIVFGAQAFLQAPFTPDLETVRSLLAETSVGMAGQRTALGNAIGLSIELFQTDSTDTRVLILLTDGVDSGSDIPPIQAARTAALDRIIIYTIGMGDPNARFADLDERMLQSIAAETGGRYFRAIDRDALEEVYQAIDDLQPIEYEEASYRPVTLLYFWPLGVLLVLTLFQQGLVALVRGRTKRQAVA